MMGNVLPREWNISDLKACENVSIVISHQANANWNDSSRWFHTLYDDKN